MTVPNVVPPDPEDWRPFTPNWVSPPGDTIKELLEVKGISLPDFALRLQVPLKDVERLLVGELRIDRELAHKLYHVLGGSFQFWESRDRNYVEGKARLGIT